LKQHDDHPTHESERLRRKFFFSHEGKKGTISFDLAKDELANELGMQIPRDVLIMVEGNHGAGKSILAQRLAYGFLMNKHSVTYISSELTTVDFIHQMKAVGYPVVRSMLGGMLRYFPVHSMIEESPERKDFLGKLTNSSILYDSEVTVIDSLSSLILNDLDPKRSLEVLSFFKRLMASGRTIVITMDPDELREDVLKPFRGTADFYIEMLVRMYGNTAQKMLSIKRFQKSIARPNELIAFRVEPELGFIVEILTIA